MRKLVLLVDDDEAFRGAFADILADEGYNVVSGKDRLEGARLWEKHSHEITVVLVDLKMPDVPDREDPPRKSGVILIQQLCQSRASEQRPVAIAAVTAFDEHEDLAAVTKAGADDMISKSWDPEDWLAAVRFCDAWVAASSGINALRGSLRLRNPYTSGHCERVRRYAQAIIPELDEANGRSFDLAACLVASAVHDVGKLAAPDDILLSTHAPLTSEERDLLTRHVLEGARVLLRLGSDFERAAEIVFLHHRWFGESRFPDPRDYPDFYPDIFAAKKDQRTPRGNEIPLEVRVLSVADTLDAMLSDRSYRAALPVKEALTVIRGRKGNQFCPSVVDALGQVSAERLEDIAGGGKIPDDASIQLQFPERRLTPDRLAALLETLRTIYLEEGVAFHRLAVSELIPPENEKPALVTFKGAPKEIEAVWKALKRRMDERRELRQQVENDRANGKEPPEHVIVETWRSIPQSIEVQLGPDEPVQRYP